jgi:tetratricopeptide (TPR) repeat protein
MELKSLLHPLLKLFYLTPVNMEILTTQSKKIAVIILSTILIQSFSSQLIAQQKRPIPLNPIMKVTNLNNANEEPMKLKVLKIDIKVIGQIAVTTLDMTYYNNNARIMEGEFNFPLGEGQSVSRFALDINGNLREGVVVEKEVGRKTFEAVVRKGVDPGLLEMTEGNNFRMRVYPLPAKGTRRIVLAFEQELTDKGKNDLYLLPMAIDEVVDKFSVHVEVIKNQVSLDSEINELNNLTFSQWNDSYVANLEKNNFTPDKQIALNFPHITDSEKIFTAKNNNSDSIYFYLSMRPEKTVRTKPLPKKITLIWDNSNSSQTRNIEKELSVLDSYFKKIANLSVELVPFNIDTEKAKTFIVSNGKWDELREAIKSMVYDGGTSFGCLDFTKYQADEILLFSDGISNFGNSEPKFSNIPVITINSSVDANHDNLTYIAQQSGGVYVNLTKLTTAEGLLLLTSNNFHFISARVENGNVSNIFPSLPCQFTNSFSLSGIMTTNSSTLLLNFGFGTTVVYTKRVNISADNSAESAFLQRIWAEKKIAELSLEPEKNKERITIVGKKFGIVTENTSLLVLENLSDYLEYDIIPPQEMQREFFRQKANLEKKASEKKQNHIEYVVKLSEEQSKWWNTDYPVPQKKPFNNNNSNNQVQLNDSVAFSSSQGLSEVVVTGYGSRRRNPLSGRVAGLQVNSSRRETEPEALMVMEEPNNDADSQGGKSKADIQINAWDPQTPYLKVLQYARAGDEYSTYLKLKMEYGLTPGFYIDASELFSKLGNRVLTLRILSNLAELKIESPELLRILGQKLLSLNNSADAITVLTKVLRLKGEEPQSYRDLGLAYEASGDAQKAINTLYEVVKRDWNNRFPGIELIVMNEINDIIAVQPGLNYSFIDKRLIKKEPVNIRVVLTWQADNCDIDLWVTDPSSEKCYYENKLTYLGGKISNDFTGGYGPEEYMIKKAIQGEYKIQANYFGTGSQSILAPVSIHLTFITNFGKIDQKKQEVTVRLENKKDVIDVGVFKF